MLVSLWGFYFQKIQIHEYKSWTWVERNSQPFSHGSWITAILVLITSVGKLDAKLFWTWCFKWTQLSTGRTYRWKRIELSRNALLSNTRKESNINAWFWSRIAFTLLYSLHDKGNCGIIKWYEVIHWFLEAYLLPHCRRSVRSIN